MQIPNAKIFKRPRPAPIRRNHPLAIVVRVRPILQGRRQGDFKMSLPQFNYGWGVPWPAFPLDAGIVGVSTLVLLTLGT
jgi:hypothetical protein